MPVKNPTQWTPPSGKGSVVSQGILFTTDNLSKFIVDNTGKFIVTTPTYTVPKHATAWTASGV